MRSKFISLSSLLFTSLFADQIGFPDDLISNRGQIRLEMSANYRNETAYNCSNLFDCSRSNMDAFTWTPGLRYGLTSRSELYTYGSWYNSRTNQTSLLLSTDSTSTQNRMNDLWLGVNHRIWDDSDLPGLLVFAQGSVMENASIGSNVNPVYGKTWQIGGTLYRSSDPIILAASAYYRYGLPKDYGNGLSVASNNTFIFNPTVTFSANNEISLTSGFQWQRQSAQTIRNIQQNITSLSKTRTDLTLGVGYMWNEKLTLHVSTGTDMTGDGGSSISIMGIYTLGDKKRKSNETHITDELRLKPSIETKTSEAKDPYIPTLKPEKLPSYESKPLETVTSPSDQSIPITIPYSTSNQKKILLSCKQIAQGWNETQMECHEIDSVSRVSQLGTFEEEIKAGQEWIQAQNPSHYTIEISIQNQKQKALLLEHLQKTRVTYSQYPSHLHPLASESFAVAMGSFSNREEALKMLETLPFVTKKSSKLLRTFRGLSLQLKSR